MEWKFRGKDLDGNWVSGDLLHMGGIVAIKDKNEEGHYIRDERTVQLCTGWRDDSGNDLYDGDVFVSDGRYMVCLWREDCLCFCFTELRYLGVKADGKKNVYISCLWETPFSGYPVYSILGNIHTEGYCKMMERFYGKK